MAQVPSSTLTFTDGASQLKQIVKKVNHLSSFSSKVTTYKSELVTIPVAATTTNNELSGFIPKTSLVTSLGIFFAEACDVGAAGTVSVAFGTTTGGVDIVASTQINTTIDIAQYVYPTTSNGLLATAGGNALVMDAAAPLYFPSNSSLFFQTIIGSNVLAATCDVKIVMEYIPEFNIG